VDVYMRVHGSPLLLRLCVCDCKVVDESESREI
jgi:hypothetical protein